MYRRELLCVGLSGAVAGCNWRPGNGQQTEETPRHRVDLREHSLIRRNVGTEDERALIRGFVRIFVSDLQYIELRAEFYDEHDEVLDTTLERIQELEEGTQEFTIEYARIGEAAQEVEDYDIAIATVI